jgi:hypothetical protein
VLRFGDALQSPIAQSDGWLFTLVYDARLTLRGLARSPQFSAMAALTIGLGIAAAVAISSARRLARRVDKPQPERVRPCQGSAVQASLRQPLQPTVIVAVTAVRVMEVAAHEVVGVPGVRHTLVAACRPVHVPLLMTPAGVIGRAVRAVHVRRTERMLVDVIAVHVVQMAVVKIVRMTLMRDRHVPARRSVLVRMVVVLLAFLCHGPTPFVRQEMATNGSAPIAAFR